MRYLEKQWDRCRDILLSSSKSNVFLRINRRSEMLWVSDALRFCTDPQGLLSTLRTAGFDCTAEKNLLYINPDYQALSKAASGLSLIMPMDTAPSAMLHLFRAMQACPTTQSITNIPLLNDILRYCSRPQHMPYLRRVRTAVTVAKKKKEPVPLLALRLFAEDLRLHQSDPSAAQDASRLLY